MPFGQTGFKKEVVSKNCSFYCTMNLSGLIDNNNCVAIDVFFVGRVGQQKGLRPSA
jgi:hypothetical protein